MKKLLVIIDMQEDFVNGSLGTKQATEIVPNIVKKIEKWDGDIIVTKDTHYEDYLNTREGKYLPVPHCIHNTEGHRIVKEIKKALKEKKITTLLKPNFGSSYFFNFKENEYDYVELIGVCTDICVVSNAIILRTSLPESTIVVDASCCAGTTIDNHKAALQVMKNCQIEIKGE